VIIGRGRIQAAGTPGELKTTCQASTLDEVFLASGWDSGNLTLSTVSTAVLGGLNKPAWRRTVP